MQLQFDFSPKRAPAPIQIQSDRLRLTPKQVTIVSALKDLGGKITKSTTKDYILLECGASWEVLDRRTFESLLRKGLLKQTCQANWKSSIEEYCADAN